MMDGQCIFCKESMSNGAPTTQLRVKGSSSINTFSEKRHDIISTTPGQSVHVECRRLYCHPTDIGKVLPSVSVTPSDSGTTRRSAEQSFSFKTDCLFCGNRISDNSMKHNKDIYHVTTKCLQESLLQQCYTRKDTWAERVQARILHVHDLPAADAIYHQVCSTSFRLGKSVPQRYVTDDVSEKKSKIGRPAKWITNPRHS